MKAMVKLALMSALYSLFGVHSVEAAVTCVENKSTGKFEEKAGGKRPTGECEAQTAMNMASSVSDIEDLSATDGTKVIGGVIVTNAAKPFASEPAKAVRPMPATTGRISTVAAVTSEASREVRSVTTASQAGEEVIVAPAVPPALPKPKWDAEKGTPWSVVLETWAKEGGWSFYWYPSKTWKVLGSTDVSDKKDVKDVSTAVEYVVGVLRSEGKAIRLRISEGNKIMEVYSTEVRND